MCDLTTLLPGLSSSSSIINLTIYILLADKLAALWPFLGIVGEVVILSTIIIIYEKNRDKVEMDDVLGDEKGTK